MTRYLVTHGKTKRSPIEALMAEQDAVAKGEATDESLVAEVEAEQEAESAPAPTPLPPPESILPAAPPVPHAPRKKSMPVPGHSHFASTPGVLPSPDDTIALIRTAASTGMEKFILKVHVKRPGESMSHHIATFNDASVAQLAMPEAWLAALFGGGEYRFRAHTPMNDDMSGGMETIGGFLMYSVQGKAFSTPDYFALEQEGYNGPREMTYPAVAQRQQAMAEAQLRRQAAGQGGLVGMAPGQGSAGLPPGFSSTPIRQAQSSNGDNTTWLGAAPAQFPMAGAFDSHSAIIQRGLETERRELAEQKAKFEREMAERNTKAEREMSEQRQKVELDRLRAEFAQRETQAVKPALDVAGLVGAFGAALTPVMAMMMNASKERADAEREQRRADADQRRADNERMMAMLARPTGPDPMVEFVMRSMQEQSKNNADMTTRMIDSVSATGKMAVQMIEVVSDLNLGGQPEGHPIIDAIKEGVRGLMTLNAAAASGAKKTAARPAAPIPAQQLPAQTAAPQQARPAQTVARAAPAPTPSARPVATPTPAVEVHKFEASTSTSPEEIPTSETIGLTSDFEGYDAEGTPRALYSQEGETVVDVMERRIRAQHRPVEELAAYIVGADENPDMIAAVEEHDGNFNSLVVARLGEWLNVEKNVDYIGELVEAVTKIIAELNEEEGEEATADSE